MNPGSAGYYTVTDKFNLNWSCKHIYAIPQTYLVRTHNPLKKAKLNFLRILLMGRGMLHKTVQNVR